MIQKFELGQVAMCQQVNYACAACAARPVSQTEIISAETAEIPREIVGKTTNQA